MKYVTGEMHLVLLDSEANICYFISFKKKNSNWAACAEQ